MNFFYYESKLKNNNIFFLGGGRGMGGWGRGERGRARVSDFFY